MNLLINLLHFYIKRIINFFLNKKELIYIYIKINHQLLKIKSFGLHILLINF